MWWNSLTMEETFIVTWGGTILGGIILGFLTYWMFGNDAS